MRYVLAAVGLVVAVVVIFVSLLVWAVVSGGSALADEDSDVRG